MTDQTSTGELCPGSGKPPKRRPSADVGPGLHRFVCATCGGRVNIFMRRMDWSRPEHLYTADHISPEQDAVTDETTDGLRRWVVGFLIDLDNDEVVLICKNRPAWMAGRLNGVGGKVEPGETPAEAMRREFVEECGPACDLDDWQEFVQVTAVTTEDRSGEVTNESGVIHFFRAFRPYVRSQHVTSATDEEVGIYRIADLDWLNVLPNLRWLVPLARHQHDTYEVVRVVETSTTLRVPSSAGEA